MDETWRDFNRVRKLDWDDFISHFPATVRHYILQLVLTPRSRVVILDPLGPNPSIPPSDGHSPLLNLPLEVRRLVLQRFLPSKTTIIHPYTPNANGNANSRTRNLLVLNKQICNELSVILYEERVFAIHVYEGISSLTSGVEFLNSGRQRLQYRHAFTELCFQRFESANTTFSFQRLRRVVFVIHPSEDREGKIDDRHDQMLTYFMLCALINILNENHDDDDEDDGDGKDSAKGLDYLKVEFADPVTTSLSSSSVSTTTNKQKNDNHWYNSDTNTPRETSIHGISNIELILRAFLRLNSVHKLEISLPSCLRKDENLTDFIKHLCEALDPKSKTKRILEDGEVARKMDSAREALDEWIFMTLFGDSGEGVEARGRDEWVEIGGVSELEDVGATDFTVAGSVVVGEGGVSDSEDGAMVSEDEEEDMMGQSLSE